MGILDGISLAWGLVTGKAPALENVSLEKLEKWLSDLNNQFPDDLKLNGVSYDRSSNESLGLTGDVSDFYVFNPSPFKISGSKVELSIRNQSATEDLSPHQKSFIQVIEDGLKRTDTSTILIDMATLAPEDWYFVAQVKDKDGNDIRGSSVIERVANFVNKVPKDKKVVIRLLVGDQDASSRKDKSWNAVKGRYEDIFWVKPSDAGKSSRPATAYEPWIKHPNATLYVGYYCPDFLVSPTDADVAGVKTFFNKILNSSLFATGKLFTSFLKGIDSDFLISQVVKNHPPSITWNHAKVLAVNGSTVMTGGVNYWNVYAQTGPHDICDTAVKIKGDTAVSAHKWADYFWSYLQHHPTSDKTSIWRGVNLSADTDGKPPTWFDASAGPVPSSTEFKKRVSSKKLESLTIARLGDWYGDKMKALRYPVQIIDAVRDILLQTAWQYFYPTGASTAGFEFIGFYFGLTDDFLTTQSSSFQELGINPTAWASRYIRSQAISKANHQVVICQQMLVDTLMNDDSRYQQLPEKVNNKVQEMDPNTKRDSWNGSIWPFELLIALAQALGNMYRSKPPAGSSAGPIYDQTSKGIFIILTTTKVKGGEDTWEDVTPLKLFVARLRIIMQNLPTNLGGVPADKIDSLLRDHLHFRRTGSKSDDVGKTLYTHSKIVCVDGKVMYVGSDNAYPNYNEEHGVWVEDADTIKGWRNDFFTPFWKVCVEPDDL